MRKATKREILLATVALTYGYIRCPEGQPRITPAIIASELCSILREEGHPLIRRFAFQSIEILTRRNFELAARSLPELLSRVRLEDRPAVIQLIVRTYLYQRQQLILGGDYRVEVNGHSYAIWTKSVRPLTPIEATLYGWLLDGKWPVAQQLAVDAFAAFEDTQLEYEEQRLRQLLAARAAAHGSTGDNGISIMPEVHDPPLLGRLAVLLAAPREPQIRSLLAPLLAELIVEGRKSWEARKARERASDVSEQTTGRAANGYPTRIISIRPSPLVGEERIAVLLARWSGVPNAATRAITAYLRKALDFYRWRWALVLLGSLLLFEAWHLLQRYLP